jgi:hypothetical protein
MNKAYRLPAVIRGQIRAVFFTGLCLLALSSGWAQSLNISQIADGGAWQTTLVFTNSTTSAQSVIVSFFQDTSGGATQPWNLAFVEPMTQPIKLAAGATMIFHTTDTAPATSTGWAQVAPVSGSTGVTAYAIFTQAVQGRPNQDGTSSADASRTCVLVPFDNTGGLVTSIGVANASTTAQNISVGIQTSDGTVTQNSLGGLPASGHTAFALPTQFPATAGKSGVAEFYIPKAGLSVLALRFNPSGGLTTAPVYPHTGTATIVNVSGSGACGAPFSEVNVDSTWTPSGNGASLALRVTPNPDGTYTATAIGALPQFLIVTFNGGTLTGNTLSFSSVGTSSVYLNGTTLAPVTSGSLTLTLSSFLTTGAPVSGTMSLKTATTSPSGPVSGTYSFFQ